MLNENHIFLFPFFELVAKGKLCIANVIPFCSVSRLSMYGSNCRPQDTDMAQNGGDELLEIVGMDS